MGEAGLTQGQGSHSHDQWRGRWERQALLKAKEQLATVIGGVDGRGQPSLKAKEHLSTVNGEVDETGRLDSKPRNT